jgi:glycosyltransferase involved in cell wall biosynthesis
MATLRTAYVLAKNEEANIERSIESLLRAGLKPVILDSGSSDRTRSLVEKFPEAEFRPFVYTTHCDSYNLITTWHGPEELVMVLDADMTLTGDIEKNAQQMFDADPALEVVKGPIDMNWEGLPLRHCNICPPKTFVFRGGKAYFEPLGHTEKLKDGTRVKQSEKGKILHDDRKAFDAVISRQWRYARSLAQRSSGGKKDWMDVLRTKTPLTIILMPLYVYIFKLGFLDGKAGIIYAIDRMMAEAFAYRASLSPLVAEENAKKSH